MWDGGTVANISRFYVDIQLLYYKAEVTIFFIHNDIWSAASVINVIHLYVSVQNDSNST